MKFDLYSVLLYFLIKYKEVDFIPFDIALHFKSEFDRVIIPFNLSYEFENNYAEIVNEDGIEYLRLKEDVNFDEVIEYYDNLPFVFALCAQMDGPLSIIGLKCKNGKISTLDMSRIRK